MGMMTKRIKRDDDDASATSIVSNEIAEKQVAKHRSNLTKGNAKTTQAVPIFLRKTYDMITSCNPDIASWSDDGSSIVLKDTDTFASEIIPQYFSHNNLSSFVRQLNFYGFRRAGRSPFNIMKRTSTATTTNHGGQDIGSSVNEDVAVKSSHSKAHPPVRYYHKKFLRGRPELLVDIRRTSNNNHNQQPTGDNTSSISSNQEDVDALKTEITELKSIITNMSNDMTNLKLVIKSLIKNQNEITTAVHHHHDDGIPSSVEQPQYPTTKKRRIMDIQPQQAYSMPVTPPQGPVSSSKPILPLPLSNHEETALSSTPDSSSSSSSSSSDVHTARERSWSCISDADLLMEDSAARNSIVQEQVTSGNVLPYKHDDTAPEPPLLGQEDFMDDLDPISLEDDSKISNINSSTIQTYNDGTKGDSMVQKLQDSLSLLPDDLKECLASQMIDGIACYFSPSSQSTSIANTTTTATTTACITAGDGIC